MLAGSQILAGKQQQQVERAAVGPMQVFQHKKHRSPLRQANQKLGHMIEQAQAFNDALTSFYDRLDQGVRA